MKKKEIVMSKNKLIVFGIIIDLLLTTIISYGTYDIINAFYGEIMPTSRINFFFTMFPYTLFIIAALLICYTLLGIKSDKKK